LLESETRFTLAVEGADVGIWDLNLLTQGLYHSPRMAHMLGYTLEELPTVREVWDALAHPDDVAPYHKNLVAHIKEAAVPFETILRLRHKNGSWRWILSRGRATRDASGRAIRISGTHSDITERKCIEESAQTADRRPRQVGVFGQHESRNSHPHEWRHWHGRHPAANRAVA
jgi:PAS domain S-box-containing protein